MEQRSRGVIITLTLVAFAAVSVSFLASGKAKRGEQQIFSLKTEAQHLSKTNRSLQANLQEAESKYKQEVLEAKNLEEALARERLRSEILARELHEQEEQELQKTAEVTTENATAKASKSNITVD